MLDDVKQIIFSKEIIQIDSYEDKYGLQIDNCNS